MTLYDITLKVKTWLPSVVHEWVLASNEEEAIQKIKNNSIYRTPYVDYEIVSIVKV